MEMSHAVTISLREKNLFFGHVCQKVSLRVLLSFCLIFCRFQPVVAHKSVAYKKSVCRQIVIERSALKCLHLILKTAKNLCPNL